MKEDHVGLEALRDYDHIVLADTSWLMYRGLMAYGNMSAMVSGIEQPTGHLYFLTQFVRSLNASLLNTCVVFSEDLRPVEKMRQVPTYKEGRDSGFDVHSGFDELVELFRYVPNVFFSRAPEREADDIITGMAKELAKTRKVTVYANDDDFSQLLAYDRIRIALKFNNGSFDYKPPNYCQEKFGVEPHELPTFRTLRGDTSDNIPGIQRFPKALAGDVARACPNFEDFPNMYKDVMALAVTTAQRDYILKIRTQYRRLLLNYQLFHCTSGITYEGIRGEVFRSGEGNPLAVCRKYNIGEKTQKGLGLNVPQEA